MKKAGRGDPQRPARRWRQRGGGDGGREAGPGGRGPARGNKEETGACPDRLSHSWRVIIETSFAIITSVFTVQ